MSSIFLKQSVNVIYDFDYQQQPIYNIYDIILKQQIYVIHFDKYIHAQTRCNKNTRFQLDSSGSSANFMSNLVGCPIGLQVALCLCHPYHFWFRPSLSVPFEIIPAWRWSFFFTKKEGTARLPTTSAGFFWVLFVREARYIVWVGTKKVPGGQSILSLWDSLPLVSSEQW